MKAILLFLLSACLFTAAAAQNVFKTPSGARYHLANCPTVKNVSQEITPAQAIELGLTPCLRCHPANVYGSAVPAPHKAKGVGEGVQCHGMTKAGNRCRHMTRIGNGYCFQHQPKR